MIKSFEHNLEQIVKMSDTKDLVDERHMKEMLERMTNTFFENASHAYLNNGNRTFMDETLKKIEMLRDANTITEDAMIYLAIGFAFGNGMNLDKYKKKPESFMEMVLNSAADVKKRKLESQ